MLILRWINYSRFFLAVKTRKTTTRLVITARKTSVAAPRPTIEPSITINSLASLEAKAPKKPENGFPKLTSARALE